MLPRKDAKISVFDSGYLVGDGIWEAVRLHQGQLVFMDMHLDRLWKAAAAVGMDLKMTRTELEEKVRYTLDANKMTDNVHVRFMVTRGIKKTPSQDPRLTISGPNLVIIAEYNLSRRQCFRGKPDLFQKMGFGLNTGTETYINQPDLNPIGQKRLHFPKG